MAILMLSASIVIVAVMFFYGYEYWHFAYERNWRSDTVWGVRLWIPYLALPVGFGLYLLQLIADLVAVLLRIVLIEYTCKLQSLLFTTKYRILRTFVASLRNFVI